MGIHTKRFLVTTSLFLTVFIMQKESAIANVVPKNYEELIAEVYEKVYICQGKIGPISGKDYLWAHNTPYDCSYHPRTCKLLHELKKEHPQSEYDIQIRQLHEFSTSHLSSFIEKIAKDEKNKVPFEKASLKISQDLKGYATSCKNSTDAIQGYISKMEALYNKIHPSELK